MNNRSVPLSAQTQQIIALHEQGLSNPEIIERIGTTRQWISLVVNAHKRRKAEGATKSIVVTNNEFGVPWLRVYRTYMGLTQTELAKRLNIGLSSIHHAENSGSVTPALAKDIAEFFGVSVDDIFIRELW